MATQTAITSTTFVTKTKTASSSAGPKNTSKASYAKATYTAKASAARNLTAPAKNGTYVAQTPTVSYNGKFALISVAPGTRFHNTAIRKVVAHPHVVSVGGNAGRDLVLTLHKDGSLSN